MKRSVKRFLAALCVSICTIMTAISCYADEVEYFIICQPDSFVWVREYAKKASAKTGYLMLGDSVWSDGKRKNGYVHVLGITEAGEGWVHSGFLIEDEPIVEKTKACIMSKGRVACRRSIRGTRRKWLKNGDEVIVYAWGEEWSVTNKGFIKSKYLQMVEASTETRRQRLMEFCLIPSTRLCVGQS